MGYSVNFWRNAINPTHAVAHHIRCIHRQSPRRNQRKWRDFESLEAIREEFPDGGETTIYGADPCCDMTIHFPPVPHELRRSAR